MAIQFLPNCVNDCTVRNGSLAMTEQRRPSRPCLASTGTVIDLLQSNGGAMLGVSAEDDIDPDLSQGWSEPPQRRRHPLGRGRPIPTTLGLFIAMPFRQSRQQ